MVTKWMYVREWKLFKKVCTIKPIICFTSHRIREERYLFLYFESLQLIKRVPVCRSFHSGPNLGLKNLRIQSGGMYKNLQNTS